MVFFSFPYTESDMKKRSPAMAIGHNEDLTTEILRRLPAKSVLRFKTVSKQWLSIFLSPRFRQIHTSGIGSATGLFLHSRPNLNLELEFLPLDNKISPSANIIPFSDNPIRIRSSSGGLLLLRSTESQSFNHQIMCDRDYFVCNPTTREFKPLAVPQLIRDSTYVCETLAFDPSKSPHYKVIFLFKSHELGEEFRIVIYSSETKTFSSPATGSANVCFRGVYCNDAVHWISCRNTCFYYFDLNRECMNKSPLSPDLVRRMQYFGESRGHLHMVSVDSEIPLFEVYELKKDYSGWSLNYLVDLASIGTATALPKMINSAIRASKFTVLSILVDEDDNLTMVLIVCGVFVACDCKKSLFSVLRDDGRFRIYASIHDNPLGMFGWPSAYQYIETLACL